MRSLCVLQEGCVQRGSNQRLRGVAGDPSPLSCRLGRAPLGEWPSPMHEPPPSVMAVFIFSSNAYNSSRII